MLDTDFDGLTDGQEAVLGTDPYLADTDGDGFSDAEELARGSSPRDATSVPSDAPLGIGLTAHGRDGMLYLVAAAYVADGAFQDATVSFGVLAGDRLLGLSPAAFARSGQVTLMERTAQDARVAVLEIPIHPRSLQVLGSLSFFATLGSASTGTVLAADARTIKIVDGIAFLLMGHEQVAAPLALIQGSGSIYVPIPPGGSEDLASSTLLPGQICFQVTQIVASSGAVVTHEVVQADCLTDWDAYCITDCSNSVGDTFRSIDPSILIGR